MLPIPLAGLSSPRSLVTTGNCPCFTYGFIGGMTSQTANEQIPSLPAASCVLFRGSLPLSPSSSCVEWE